MGTQGTSAFSFPSPQQAALDSAKPDEIDNLVQLNPRKKRVELKR